MCRASLWARKLTVRLGDVATGAGHLVVCCNDNAQFVTQSLSIYPRGSP